jgi:hypothetical protein
MNNPFSSSSWILQTVGYGDIFPLEREQGTLVFLIFYITFTTFFIAIAINDFTHHFEKESQMRTRKKELKKLKNMDFLADLNGGKGLTKGEFVLAILVHKGVLDKAKDVDPWIGVRPLELMWILILKLVFSYL